MNRRIKLPLIFMLISLMTMSLMAAFDTNKTPLNELLIKIDEAVKLKKTPSSFITHLMESLEDPNSEVRLKERCAWALGKVGGKKAIATLIEATEHKGLLVRSAALNSLIDLQATEGIQAYTRIATSDPALSLRERATIALALVASEKSIPIITQLASDEKEEIKGASCFAMATLHSQKNNFLELIKDMKNEPSLYVQERAKFAESYCMRKSDIMKTYLKNQNADIRLFADRYFKSRVNKKPNTSTKKKLNNNKSR